MRKLENQREIIFNTAKRILTSEEAGKFSIRMISKECNIGMGTIYKYYGNKDEIILDITRDLWMNYIKSVKSTTTKYSSFTAYVEFLFNELEEYSKRFNYIVLSKELSYNFRKSGKLQHQEAQDIFFSLIKNELCKYYDINLEKAELLANFIANNLVAMITNKEYRFDVFRSILDELLKQYKEKK